MTNTTKKAIENSKKKLATRNFYDIKNHITIQTNSAEEIAKYEKSKDFTEHKNTIDYRYNEVDDVKYTKIQSLLVQNLQLEKDCDMRIVKDLFTVSVLANTVALTVNNSMILNRRDCFEIELSKKDYDLLINSELKNKIVLMKCESNHYAKKKAQCVITDLFTSNISEDDTRQASYSIKIDSRDILDKFNAITNVKASTKKQTAKQA